MDFDSISLGIERLKDCQTTCRKFLWHGEVFWEKLDATQYYNKEEKKEGLLTISGFKQEKLTSSLNTL